MASAEFQTEFLAAMDEVGRETASALGDNLASLWLGGGLGRGEGAVTRVSGKEQAYNDVDLFLYVNDASSVDSSKLRALEAKYTALLGAHLEYCAPIEVRSIARMRSTLMWFDALQGHHVIAGRTDLAGLFSENVHREVPVAEGPRLLLNRAAGLIWAMRVAKGLEPAPDADFVRRNCWKARLALMEAALIVEGRYVEAVLNVKSGLPTERKRLAFAALPNAYRSEFLSPTEVAEACRFKQDPDSLPGEPDVLSVAAKFESAFREIEARRFGSDFSTPEAYANFASDREPATALRETLGNLARNAKRGKLSTSNRRESLYRDASLLLVNREPEWNERSARFLETWRRVC